MIAPLRLSYVLPVHNQEASLRASVVRLSQRLRQFPGSEVLLIENGSTDDSGAVCRALAAELTTDGVSVRAATSPRGMGHAYQRGLQLMSDATDVAVLSAADLPFGYTDLDAFIRIVPRPEIAVASKSHVDSVTEIPATRKVMSAVFNTLRRALVGLTVSDSQGVCIIDARLARRVLPQLQCGDYLISTEIDCWAERYGATIVELPVVYRATGQSTVSPLRDSMRMAAGLVALRRRLRKSRAVARSTRTA